MSHIYPRFKHSLTIDTSISVTKTNKNCQCNHDIRCSKCGGNGSCSECNEYVYPEWMNGRCINWWKKTFWYLNDKNVIWPGVDIENIKVYDIGSIKKNKKNNST